MNEHPAERADELMDYLGLPREAQYDFSRAIIDSIPEEAREKIAASVELENNSYSAIEYEKDQYIELVKYTRDSSIDNFSFNFLASSLSSILYTNVLAYLRMRLSPSVFDEHVPLRLLVPFPLTWRHGRTATAMDVLRPHLVVTSVPPPEADPWPWKATSPPAPYALVVEHDVPAPAEPGGRLLLNIDGQTRLFVDFAVAPIQVIREQEWSVSAADAEPREKREGRERQGALLERYIRLLVATLHWVLARQTSGQDAPWWQIPQGVFCLPQLDVGGMFPGGAGVRSALRPVLECLRAGIVPQEQEDRCLISLLAPSHRGSALFHFVPLGEFPQAPADKILLYDAEGESKASWGLSARAFLRRQQLISRDAQNDPRVLDARAEGVYQAMATPVVLGPTGLLPQDLREAYMVDDAPPGEGRHYHDYGVVYIALTDPGLSFEPEHVIFARHVAGILAELLSHMEARFKRDELARSALEMVNYDRLLAWVDPDYFLPSSALVKTVEGWVTGEPPTLPQEYDRAGLPGSRSWVSFVLVSFDQKETLFRDRGGDQQLALAYHALRTLIGRILDDRYASSLTAVSDYQHDVLVAVKDLDLPGAWRLADEIRKRQNLGAEPALADFRRTIDKPTTVSVMIFTTDRERLRTWGFGRSQREAGQDPLWSLDIALRRLKKAYETARAKQRRKLSQSDKSDTALAGIFWINPDAPDQQVAEGNLANTMEQPQERELGAAE